MSSPMATLPFCVCRAATAADASAEMLRAPLHRGLIANTHPSVGSAALRGPQESTAHRLLLTIEEWAHVHEGVGLQRCCPPPTAEPLAHARRTVGAVNEITGMDDALSWRLASARAQTVR